MTDHPPISWDDTVLPFQLDNTDIRGRFARLSVSVETILDQHDYPPMIASLVAEMALLTALIGQTIKLRWKLSLQVRGSGAVKMIATDYYGASDEGGAAQIRAYASYNADEIDPNKPAFDQLGDGVFGILIDQGPDMTPYQGITPIAGGSLSGCAEAYFAQSEQIPTRFALAFGKSKQPTQQESWRAGGIMIQHMPKASPAAAQPEPTGDDGLLSAADMLDQDDEENWARVNILLDTVDETELVGPHLASTDVLLRLFHEEGPRVFEAQPIAFGCTCSETRVRDSLAGYKTEDLSDLVTDKGVITADCQFCGAHYEFAPDSLGA